MEAKRNVTTDFWQKHSLHYLEMAFRTDRHERIETPDGYGTRTGDCGDRVDFYLRIFRQRIQTVAFTVAGCMNTNACANTLAQMAEGRTVEEAWKIEVEDIVDYLETLPPDHTHCAELAMGAFYRALNHYRQLQREPWKKSYPVQGG